MLWLYRVGVAPAVRYRVVQHREGPADQLEVLSDRSLALYMVKKSLGSRTDGDTRRIERDAVYVRQSSITAVTSDKELEALRDEAARVRAVRDRGLRMVPSG